MACPQGIETSNVQFLSAVKKQYKVQTVFADMCHHCNVRKITFIYFEFVFTFPDLLFFRCLKFKNG